MSKCVSHVLAPWSSLPVGWGEEGFGGVGWDINVMSTCVSHVLAPWSSLPVGWGKEGWGGVGY